MIRSRTPLASILVACLCLQAAAQSDRSPEITHDRLRVQWTADGNWMWYAVNVGGGRFEHFSVDVRSGDKSALLEAGPLAAALSQKLEREISREAVERLSSVMLLADGTCQFR